MNPAFSGGNHPTYYLVYLKQMVELESLTKTYTLGQQRIVAVNDVSLTIQPGEFVAIMGKSGCGKTTLLV